MPLEHVGGPHEASHAPWVRRGMLSGAPITRAASDAQHNAKFRAQRKREDAAASGTEDTEILSKLTGVHRSVSWGRSNTRPASLGFSPSASPGTLRSTLTLPKNSREPAVLEEDCKTSSATSSPASSSALSLRTIGAHGHTRSMSGRELPSPTKGPPLKIDTDTHHTDNSLSLTAPLSVNKDLPAVPLPEIDIEADTPIDRGSLEHQSGEFEWPMRTRKPSWVSVEGQSAFPRRSISTSSEIRPVLPETRAASRRHMNAYMARPRRSTPNLAHDIAAAKESVARTSRSLVASPTQDGFLPSTRAQLTTMFSHFLHDSKGFPGQDSPQDSPVSSTISFSRRNSRDSDRSRAGAQNYLQNISQILPRPLPSPLASAYASSGEDVSDNEERIPRSRVSSAADQTMPSEQASLKDYELGSEIGRGAYGFVRRARLRSSKSDYPFLIKYIYKSCILADSWQRHSIFGILPTEIFILMQVQSIPFEPPEEVPPWIIDRQYWLWRRGLLLEEQRQGKKVGHPSVCGIIDFFEDPEYYYVVMPRFGDGRDLFDEVESNTFGLDDIRVRCYLGQIAEALAFLHKNGFVHRDVKDENVIIDEHCMIQLIDFGSAARIRTGRMFDTFSGTLDYAPAEILEGKPYAGPPQDIWSFGIVAFVLVCGECPFRDGTEACEGLVEGSRPLELLRHFCHDDYMSDGIPSDPLDDVFDSADPDGGGTSNDVMDLIQQCLQLDPDKRPSAAEVMHHRFIIGSSGWTGTSRHAM